MPIIGVLPLVDRERESYWMLPGYMEGVLEAGSAAGRFAARSSSFPYIVSYQKRLLTPKND